MIRGKNNKTGLRFWIFFEHSAFPFMVTWYKKFPFLILGICNKKKQQWYDL